MTVLIHESMNRGRSRLGWVDAFHSFSFGGFHDPMRMGHGRLRVLNEDRIAPGAGFPAHDHADIDVLTLVLKGRLRHEDDMGHVEEIGAGEAQLMRAGSGVTHSEVNPSPDEAAKALQIWLVPRLRGGDPAYARARLPEGAGPHLLASGDGEGALRLGSDVRVWWGRPQEGARSRFDLGPGRKGFVQLVEGFGTMEAERLVAGDGLQLEETPPELLWASEGAYLFFDLPA
ncbi:pirin family protein [uncultured Albimonas sp.]|uniref:pirin family protein n=1 Tax=uncultured Albimonas sp. TaxID=1331701 RepID=UPI0030ED1628